MPVLTYLHQLFNAALILDSRIAELRIVYTKTLSENHDSFLRLWKDNDFKEERMTKVGLYAISTSTTLESNKSLEKNVLLTRFGNY